jgi:hypothetical protein
MSQIFAQTSQALEALSPQMLFAYGPMGIVLAWFMWRAERGFAKIADLAHRIDGLTKALLVDMVERDNAGLHVREYAAETIAKIDARNKKDES